MSYSASRVLRTFPKDIAMRFAALSLAGLGLCTILMSAVVVASHDLHFRTVDLDKGLWVTRVHFEE